LKTSPALLTESERARYQQFLFAAEERLARDQEHLAQLRSRFNLSVAIDEDERSTTLAVMYSQVRVRNLTSGKAHVETVALPPDAEVLASRRALSSWAGPLLLGAREGDEIHWPNEGVLERLRVEQVLCQPGVAVLPPVTPVQARQQETQHVSPKAAAANGQPSAHERSI
jgi:regulator of nucleoside diphosphate kinase